MHEKLKELTHISEANCLSCIHLEIDGEEWHTYAICNNKKRKGVDNLKSFPFHKEQKCWYPDFWQSNYADKVYDDAIMKAQLTQFTKDVEQCLNSYLD